MSSYGENFSLSGPLHLSSVNWSNVHHRSSVAACLVQAVYVLERDRQQKRYGSDAFAPPWWEFFHFQLIERLVDNADGSIFGAIFQLKPCSLERSPCYVIAFRGTVNKPDSIFQDLSLDLHIIRNGLHLTPRFEIAMQAVYRVVGTFGDSSIWLAGHSLGAAMALLAGKNVARSGIYLETFLFNPPYLSAPIEKIKDKKTRHGIRIASSFIAAGLAVALKASSSDAFVALSPWVPNLFVNRLDHICAEYVGYFEHRSVMEKIRAGGIERLASHNSLGSLAMRAFGTNSEPLHVIPSANLNVNLSQLPSFKRAHGIHQWWASDIILDSKIYLYN